MSSKSYITARDCDVFKPWFGWGFRGIYGNVEWGPESLNRLGISSSDWINTHIQWMESIVSYGIPGGAIFILVWVLSGKLVLFCLKDKIHLEYGIGVLLFLNWVNLSMAGFATVFVESEWAIWVSTLLGATIIWERKGRAKKNDLPVLAL